MRPTTPAHASLNDLIAREAIPFSLDSRAEFDAGVAVIVASLDESFELLGFGEALHGGEDILMLRNRLFQRLVEAHGFSAIAVESSFPRARLVNEYVAGRGPMSYEAVEESGFGHGFGRLDANRELVEWMREHNADRHLGTTLQFYGFDLPGVTAGPASPREVLDFVLDYLASMDDNRGQRMHIEPLLGEDSNWENPLVWRDPAKAAPLLSALAALRVVTEELISELRVRRPELIAKSDKSRYLDVVQHARVARQLLSFFAALAQDPGYAASLGVRDALMADNLAYIVARERGRGRVLAFAHNKHLQRGMAQWQLGPDLCQWWPAGAHLDEMFGSRYATIGSAVGVSEANGIAAPEAGSLEARLIAAPGPARFIATHKGRGLPAEEIAALTTRSGSKRNPTYFALTPESFRDFDWLAVLNTTAYNRGGPPLRS